MFSGPFFPRYGTGQTVTTGAASAAVRIGDSNTRNQSVRIQNTSATNGCFVRIYSSAKFPVAPSASATSPNADIFIGPDSYMTLSKALEDDYLAYIQSGGPATLWIITGDGGLL